MSDIDRRALEWFASGDTGMSSVAICQHMADLEKDDWMCAPSDPSDMGRCLRLLEKVPEWKSRIGEMAVYGEEWRALVARWDEVAQSMVDEVGIDWSKSRCAPKTYALMRSILDPAERTTGVVRFGQVSIAARD